MEILIDYFLQNHDKLLYLIAGFLLVLELTVIGLSGPVLFVAIGSGLTGLYVSAGIISDWELEIFSVGIHSLISALILWKPLKKFQGEKQVVDTSSDMIGQIVPVSEEVTVNGGNIRHSGISWQARLDPASSVDTLAAGVRVEICAVEGNVMIVKLQN